MTAGTRTMKRADKARLRRQVLMVYDSIMHQTYRDWSVKGYDSLELRSEVGRILTAHLLRRQARQATIMAQANRRLRRAAGDALATAAVAAGIALARHGDGQHG